LDNPVRPSGDAGRDLPDADNPGFLALTGGFRAENRSLIGRSGPSTSRIVVGKADIRWVR
jgi:hypothetical protein